MPEMGRGLPIGFINVYCMPEMGKGLPILLFMSNVPEMGKGLPILLFIIIYHVKINV